MRWLLLVFLVLTVSQLRADEFTNAFKNAHKGEELAQCIL
jgi:hypothetical protein